MTAWVERLVKPISLFPLLSAKDLSDRIVCWTIKAYQWANKNSRLIKTDPSKQLGMAILTGDPSTSQWTLNETLRQETIRQSLGAFGAALIFISDSFMKVVKVEGNELIIHHPPLPESISLQLEEKDAHIEVNPNISSRKALGLFAQGLIVLGGSIADYYLIKGAVLLGKKYQGIPDNATILAVRNGGKEIDIEVVDDPGRPPSGWGDKGQPPTTHTETRVEFKGHYYYRKEDVRREGSGLW